MAAQMNQEWSLNVPFLAKWKPNELGDATDEEAAVNCHAPPTKGVSFLKTCINGLNALSGIGMLSIPYALASGGWLSLILLFGIAMAAFYTGLLMKRCMDMNSDIRSYPDIGEHAFGKKGRMLVSMSMYTELYLVAAGFLILEGDNLSNIFPNVELEFAGFAIGGKQFFAILIGLVIMPSVWLDDLSLLSFVSASGVFASALILCSIFWAAAVDEGIGFHNHGNLLNWAGIPTSISLYAFCYCAHPVFPTLYTSMRNRNQFSSVLLVCFVVSTIGYASMAIFGYLMFGSKVESQITLNLPTSKISSKVAIYTTLVNPITKYALMVTPIKNALRSLLPQQCKSRLTNTLISTTLVISTVVVALAVPFFGYLMSLVGAFLSVTASIILPCSCYLKISGTYKRLGGEFIAIMGIILVGVAVAILGTYTSLVDIVDHL